MTEQDQATAPEPSNQADPAKELTDLTGSAIKEQTLDSFNSLGWTKVIAPAKVNLLLSIGDRQSDGYHQATSLMHALNIHDVLYMRRAWADPESGLVVRLSCTGVGDIEAPDVDPADNLAAQAVTELAARLGRAEDEAIEIRIEKNIPCQAGLGGGSADAAAALIGAAHLWGVGPADPAIEASARALGADVAFFLRGGCGLYAGVGDAFDRALAPMKKPVVLVKPDGGVSTAQAYATFDENSTPTSAEALDAAATAASAADVVLANNLAPAAEALMPELAMVRTWLAEQPGVEQTLLSGSGAATFAICDSLEAALAVVAAARKRGWWARSTSFGSLRAAIVPQG